ncbi:unnamed protein product [Rhizophagus irregularis]|nr:unnamed protein product [Rhizophagus irregularis]
MTTRYNAMIKYHRMMLPDWSYVDQPDMVYDTEYTDDLNIDDEDLDAILEDKADKSEVYARRLMFAYYISKFEKALIHTSIRVDQHQLVVQRD